MTDDVRVHPQPVEYLFRQIVSSPGCGRSWFALGTSQAPDEGERGYLVHLALYRSLLTSPRDEAASRAFLREDFRLYGAKSALDKLAHDEAVSNSYESTGTLAVALLHRGDTCGAHSLFQRCLALAPERREAAERIGQMSLDFLSSVG